MDSKLYSTIKRMNYVLKKHITNFNETSWLTGHRYSDKEVAILNACFDAGKLTSHGFKPCDDYEEILKLSKYSKVVVCHKKQALTYVDIVDTGLIQFVECNEPETTEQSDEPEAAEQQKEKQQKKEPEKSEQKKPAKKKSAAKDCPGSGWATP